MSSTQMDFLVCYDISDKKRLSSVARAIEKQAMRIQRSVYLYTEVTRAEMGDLVAQIQKLIDKEADDVRIYTIRDRGIALGNATDLNNPLILT